MKEFLDKLNWISILAVVVAVETQIGSGTMTITHMFPAAWVPGIQEGMGNLGSIGAMILSVGAYGRLPAGQVQVPPVVKAALFLAVATALLMSSGGSAQAQGLPKLRPLTGNIASDLGIAASNKSAAALDSIATVLAKPFQDIANFIGADADGAVSLSTVIPNLQDGHGQQCWIAMKSFGDIIKAHPVPVTFHVINDYESLRLLGIATNNLCSNVHCTQVFADFTAMAQAASPVPLAIPSLHDLCTKVPQIAVVAPVTVPAPAAAPADLTK